MSFYGDIKRIKSSPYVFDKYYPNRKTMDESANSDGIYIGRYVLVKYNYQEDGSYVEKTDPKFQANIDADISVYNDTFDATVWQKIYTNLGDQTEKYILVAELNASAPRLNLDIVAPKYIEDNEEKWRQPAVDVSNEMSYTIKMPNVLQLEVNTDSIENLYPVELMDPKTKTIIKDDDGNVLSNEQLFSEDYNYLKWVNNYSEENPQDIIGKTLSTKLYAFGQAVSNLYDILYGTPTDQNGGLRPNYSSTSYQGDGLLGILNSIGVEEIGDGSQDSEGRPLPAGARYYLISKWSDALEDPDHFIENIPSIVGASKNAGGSSAKSHYFIDFNNENGEYISKSWE